MNDYTIQRPILDCDTECYPNLWAIGFYRASDRKTVKIEMFNNSPLDRARIATILRSYRIYGFNLAKYDIPMILLAMRPGTTNEMLKQASDEIILTNIAPWKFMEKHGLVLPDFIDYVDLMDVSPGAPQRLSLKHSGARLHCETIQELPIEPDCVLSETQREAITGPYLSNDLAVTALMRKELSAQIALREQMSNQYGVDLRSKSDAQIAEAVIKAEVERITGKRLWRPDVEPHTFKYEAPSYIQFKSPELRQLLHNIENATFVVDYSGVVRLPEFLEGKKVTIGGSTYKMGIGGLHSTEECVSHFTDDENMLLDRDVASYYPAIIIGERLAPKHIGQPFLDVYAGIRERRLNAKRAGDKNTAESLKIVLNGNFGKFGQPFSVLYSPKLMIQTTVTGQLALLMQIETLESLGIPVISANTDGIVSKVPKSRAWHFKAAFTDWEWATGYETEETAYRSLHSASVNAYLAVKPDGKMKSKGFLTEGGPGQAGASGLKKNPAAEICADAARQYLSKGTPVEHTINRCRDIRKFLVVRRVTGGAEKDGAPIGKVVRYYFSNATRTPLIYVKNGNKVPRSDGAMPMMTLPDLWDVPEDLDLGWYIREAFAILEDVGMGAVDPSLRGRSGRFLGLLGMQKTAHWVDAQTGVAICGKTRESIRDKWIEGDYLGGRICAKCRKVE